MVKRVHKSSDGKYHVAGKSFHHLVGSRAQVHHGKAYKTTGPLVAFQDSEDQNVSIIPQLYCTFVLFISFKIYYCIFLRY